VEAPAKIGASIYAQQAITEVFALAIFTIDAACLVTPNVKNSISKKYFN